MRQRRRPAPCSRNTSYESRCGPTPPPGAARLTMTSSSRAYGRNAKRCSNASTRWSWRLTPCTNSVHARAGGLRRSAREKGPWRKCHFPPLRETARDSTSSRRASRSNSGGWTIPLKPGIALRTSRGRFCQWRDRNCFSVMPPSSCKVIARIIGFAQVETVPLQAGEPAPLFSLPDADMESVDLSRFRGKKHVVLYFYPRDGTPACTLQATDFSDHEDEFARHDCVVIGVSPDDCLCHAEFRDQHGVSIRLLADTECEVSQKYGVWLQKQGDNAAGKAC